MQFAADGTLFVSTGDGGGEGAAAFRASVEDPQDPSSLHGKLLRVRPNVGADGYEVPADNPFADGGGAPEVWALGFRNPWRIDLDEQTGDLWVADVGFGHREEIDRLAAPDRGRGDNFGWGILEGTRFVNQGPAPPGAVDPLYEYDHADGACAVVGGTVYRGRWFPQLRGQVVFADLGVGRLQAVDGDGEVTDLGIEVPTHSPVSIDPGPEGELYVSDVNDALYRLDPA
jgi:glucose/arabinose dehydrogenase